MVKMSNKRLVDIKLEKERGIKRPKLGFWDIFRSKYYVIKREDDKTYTASIALRFSPTRGYNGPVPRSQVHEHYMQRVKSCIENEVNPYLLGPDGKRLRIQILERGVQSNVPTHSIRIASDRVRSTWKKYESDISCEIIAHEILHLLGLPDEYEERHAGHHVNARDGKVHSEGYKVNCRVVQAK